jgi:two-component system phosphate regulon sensor histidine kinase PhoR
MSIASLTSFLAGLTLGGIVCYWWQRFQWQQQLDNLLAVVGDRQERNALPTISQLRRKIAESQEQQQVLASKLKSYADLLDRVPTGYLQVDGENQILACNPIARQLLHIHNWPADRGKMLLKSVLSYELDRLIEDTRQSQNFKQLDWQFHPRYITEGDSTAQWLGAIGIPLVAGEVGIFINSQQSQIDAAQARSRWIADLAHELRTPLTSIRLVAENLQDKVPDSLQRWVDRILQATQRLIDLIQNFLDLSNLEESPSQYIKLADVDAIEVIHHAWQTLEPIAQQRQIKLVYTGLQELHLEADAARLTQVFLNLFDNSIKYSPDGGEIKVHIRQSPELEFTPDRRELPFDSPLLARRSREFPAIWLDVPLKDQVLPTDDRHTRAGVEIDIEDEGSGFNPADLPYIFDRLFRSDPARYRDPQTGQEITAKGSGLGLAIVRQIIVAHGGNIIARNHPQTGGAWMQIQLPLDRE